MKHGCLATILTSLALGLPMGAHASSEEAWDQLRKDLAESCTELAQAAMPEAKVDLRLNEYGSDSYAVALVTSTASQGQELSVCIYDKRTGDAQLTTAFPDVAQ